MCVVPVASARSSADPSSHIRFQTGVVRTNCIDCLDRTNVWQYAYGIAALGQQLKGLGLLDVGEVETDCSLAHQVMEMYEKMGNTLALQYGGSEAHGAFFHRMRGASEVGAQSKEVVTTLK